MTLQPGVVRVVLDGKKLAENVEKFIVRGGSARAAEGPTLKTIPNVKIVNTGTFHLAGNPYDPGQTTFTEEDLMDAVAAVEDSSVKDPRLKLGHTSDWGDAEPAFGKVTNMRYDAEAQAIFGDYTGTPAWLAEVLPAVYPNRSIEALFNVTTASGNKYRMVITAVALLGVQLPGVATLEDLAGLYTEEVPEGVTINEGDEADAEAVVANLGEEDDVRLPGRRKAAASTNLEDIRRAFYETWAIGDNYYWWIREVFLDPNELIVDDGDGALYSMTFDIGGKEIEFGEPEARQIKYVKASDGSLKPTLPELREGAAVAFASRAESRPEPTQQEDGMDKVRERLGLPADATEEDILRAMDQQQEGDGEESGGESGDGDGATQDASNEGGDEQPAGEEQPQEAETPAAASNGLPDGMVAVPADQWAAVQAGAQAGAQLAESTETERRDRTITAAIGDGKIRPSDKDSMVNLHKTNREGFYNLLTASVENGGLASNLYPVAETGSAPSEEGQREAEATEHRSWLTPREVAIASGEVTLGGAPGSIVKEGV